MEGSKERLIKKIASYMRDEQFGIVHLDAILSIVVSMNLNADTEAEVLEFAGVWQARLHDLQRGLSLRITCREGEGSLAEVCPEHLRIREFPGE